MRRCDEPAGRYRVEFQYVDNNGRVQDYPVNVPIGEHEDFEDAAPFEAAPRLSQSEPFEGELCIHEVVWLAMPPGQAFNRHWQFTVTKLGRSTK